MSSLAEIMNDIEFKQTLTPTQRTNLHRRKSGDFLSMLDRLNARKLDSQSVRQKAIEDKDDADDKSTRRRINELLSLIAMLRQRVVSSGFDRGVMAQLSAAQTELLWLMSGM